MELRENVSPSMIADINHDETCYFCNAKEEPRTEENDLSDDYAEDADLDGLTPEGVIFKNDAGKLGRALGGHPGQLKVELYSQPDRSAKRRKVEYPVAAAAHHLIPGNASLKKSSLYESEEYLWADGKAKGNIGYNINSAPNGVWLPGNYAIRPWGTNGAAFQEKSSGIEPKDYAFAAIEAWKRQFHDAHEDYSDQVRQALDKIYDKLEANETIWCPEAKKRSKNPDEKSPLYVLVNRLHTVSARMKKMLVFPTANWKKNIWTSAFSLAYMNEK